MRSAAALLAVWSVGCSFVMTNAPSYVRDDPTRCGESRVPPVLDVIGAVASVAVAATLAFAIQREDGPTLRSAAFLGVGVALGATYAYAAVTGVERSHRCRTAIAAWRDTHR